MAQKKDVFEENLITKKRWLKALCILLICVAACTLYYQFIVINTYVELELVVSKKTDFKIFWAEKDEPFSEMRMAGVKVHPGKTKYGFYLTDLRKVDKLRFDPFSYTGEAFIKSIKLSQQGREEILISGAEQFNNLKPANHIKDSQIVNGGMEVESEGSDPFFEMTIVPGLKEIDKTWLGIRLLFITVILLIVINWGGSLVKQFRFVPLLLFGAWLLIIIMAGISKKNAHPDEYVHMYAAQYYQDHWVPPVIDDPEIRKTYSVYGVSRLNDREIFYLFSGKFEQLMEGFRVSRLMSKRLFNVALFGLIFLYTVRNRRARLVALPLLLSAQIWYVFSYCTSDALAITVAFFAACQLVDSDSLMQRYLKGANWRVSVLSVITTTILVGLMFLLKKNYYPFIAFFFFCMGLKLFFTEEYYWERKQAFLRFSLITLLGLTIFGARVGLDYHVNGVDRQQKLTTIQEDLAHYKYKPSTPLDQKNLSIKSKDRGVTLKDVFHRYHWGEQAFQSSFGVFGYFTIVASNAYYDLVRITGLCLFAFVFGSILLRGGWLGGTMVVTTLGFSIALIAVSAYLSWTVDFQPQGRYLFPIAAMSGMLYGMFHKIVNVQMVSLGVVTMYLLACYNFIFYGLMMIPKIPI